MAAATEIEIFDGAAQFQGLYKRIWQIRAIGNPDSLNTTSNPMGILTIAVPGVKRGDHIISWGAWPTNGATGSSHYAEILWSWGIIQDDQVKGHYFQAEGSTRDIVELEFGLVVGRPAPWNIEDKT